MTTQQQQQVPTMKPEFNGNNQQEVPSTLVNNSFNSQSNTQQTNQSLTQQQQETQNAISGESVLNSSLNKNSILNQSSQQQQSPLTNNSNINNNTNAAIIDEASQTSTSSSHNESERTETPKLKQQHSHSHPTTPNLCSPSNVSMSSLQDEYDNSNPSWPPASPIVNNDHIKHKVSFDCDHIFF
jgi:hypothetical protein